ncbi:MAG: EAL domain-containing protein [Oceanicoccus sp.]
MKIINSKESGTSIWSRVTARLSEVVSSSSDYIRQTRFFSRRQSLERGRQGSLVGRFQILLVAWGLIVCLITTGGFWLISSKAMHAHVEQDTDRWMNRIMKITRSTYTPSDTADLFSVKEYAQHFPEISYIQILSADGSALLDEYTSAALDSKEVPSARNDVPGDSVARYFETDGLTMVIGEAVVVSGLGVGASSNDSNRNNRVVAHVRMGLDFSVLKSVRWSVIADGSLLILILFLIAAIVGRRLIKYALKPLLDLREPLDRLARGETDVWIHQSGDEEIEAIRNALNSTITAIKGRDEALRRLADYDALTGLINKRSFTDVLEQERARVVAGSAGSALLFIDLDQFKFVNDSLGHAAGDKLLVQISGLLKKRMRNDDVVCRLGGDEFAVLARAVDEKGAVEIASSIVKSMEGFLFVEQGKTFNICCSVGVALIDDNSFTAEDIFSQADMACYSAKAKGRNQHRLYLPAAVDKNKMDVGWSQRIVSALTNNRFVLHYQPIISVANDTGQCYEVLPRMNEGAGELVLPKMFIPIAERFGLVTEIDYWVIKHSMEKLELMNREGKKSRFYINLSGQLFIDPDFSNRVMAMLKSYDIDAGQIVFEMKERVVVDNMGSASEKIKELIAFGFDFAIDDFGSSFSSFSYLKDMPSGYVKIDGEMVERMVDNKIDCAMVRSMIDIAKACGKKVIAEHVCDQQTYDLLKSFGVDYAQGYFLGRPSSNLSRLDPQVSSKSNVTLLGSRK